MRISAKHFVILPFLSVATPLWAAEPMRCFGQNPEWTLELGDQSAEFTFLNPLDYEIPQATTALNREWPKAFTLIARASTAIVVMDQDICQLDGTEYPISADILTQDGTEAVVLTGCCLQAGE